MDRGARLAEIYGDPELAARWQQMADEIQRGDPDPRVSERGVFRQHYDTDALDASLLLMPIVRFLPPDDERLGKTVLAIADELTEHGLVLRYKVDETDDGLTGKEGTFAICTFWLVAALSEIGDKPRAGPCASGCFRWPRRWGCMARKSRPRPAATWATSRRPSRTWR